MFNLLNKYNIGKKKLVGIIMLVIFLIFLPLILIQVQKQQQIKQRAEGSDSLHLELSLPAKTLKKEESFNTIISLINPFAKDISAIDVIITYSSDKLKLNSFDPVADVSGFTTIINEASVSGRIHYIGVKPNPSHHNNNNFFIGRLSFTGKEQGVGIVGFENVTVTAIGEQKQLVINPADNKSGTYTISEPTPTTVQLAHQTPQIISCGINNNSNPAWASVDGVTKYRLDWCYKNANFTADAFGNNFCSTILTSGTSANLNFPEGSSPFYEVRVRSEVSKDSSTAGEWSEIKSCTRNSSTPTSDPSKFQPIPKFQVTLDKQIFFEGENVKVSVKVDSNVDGVRLFYGTSDEILAGDFYDFKFPDFFKSCGSTRECLGTFFISIPKGDVLKIIVKGHTPQGNIIVSEIKSLPIRHFSANAGPSFGSPGTLFTITAKTEINSEVKATVSGPGINNESATLYDDGNHGDGAAKDGIYGYVFHSPDSQVGVYTANFTVDNQQISNATSVRTNDSDRACKPYTNLNGNLLNKINIVVISSNYSESELDQFQSEVLPRHANFLLSKEPYLSNKDKINVFFVKKDTGINCDTFNAGGCFSVAKSVISSVCPFYDKLIILDKSGGGGYTFGARSNAILIGGASIFGSEGATLHEFGHVMGDLADEYEAHGGPSNTSFANCDTFACPKWCSGNSSLEKPLCNSFNTQSECAVKKYNGVNCVWFGAQKKCDYPYSSNINFGQACIQDSVCLYGCGGTDGYRSSNYSIMGDPNDGKVREYNTVSKIQIQKMIDLLWKQKNN